ncbi:MAG: hypothetical protein DI603_22275 [Roseateles depolymerans]|uniref:Prepilin-type N-terminal cleavage/methylation domain-containing protein n=1 Tax=Roseateles depolymerans TaxID=76731 RepID=A0A2W5F481_9BURK|nr:MAG: hypothetical protein DI603_22275 [Roseateles depolymerans]
MLARQRGFTLLEVLVVVVITALVSGLMFQALAYVGRLQARFGEQLARGQQGAMRADWYRQLLQGVQADFSDAKRKFSGRADHLEGLSSTGLDIALGAMNWVELDLRARREGVGGEVILRVDGKEVQLLDWRSEGAAAFSYVDDAGQVYSSWPPESLVTAKAGAPVPQLPSAIFLNVPDQAGARVIVAVPRGSRESRPRDASEVRF